MRPPGPWEIGLILIIILIVFGVGKLPQVGESIGKGLKAFRRGQSGEEEDKSKPMAAQSELEVTKAKLEAAEAKLKLAESQSKAEKNN